MTTRYRISFAPLVLSHIGHYVECPALYDVHRITEADARGDELVRVFRDTTDLLEYVGE